MSPNLAIVERDVAHKDSPAIRIGADLVCYMEEQVRAISMTSPITHRTYKPPYSQSILSSVDIRRLIRETQFKPFTSDGRWLSLVYSSCAMSWLADSLIHPLVLLITKVPELPQYDTTEGNPYDHITNLKNKLPLYEDEGLYYKLFPTTIQGEAIDWYTRLPPKSINSWLEFAKFSLKGPGIMCFLRNHSEIFIIASKTKAILSILICKVSRPWLPWF